VSPVDRRSDRSADAARWAASVAFDDGAAPGDVDGGFLGGGQFPAGQEVPVDVGAPSVGAVAELFSVGSVPDKGSEHGQAERCVVGVEMFGHGRGGSTSADLTRLRRGRGESCDLDAGNPAGLASSEPGTNDADGRGR
jgi:hypothetical protein